MTKSTTPTKDSPKPEEKKEMKTDGTSGTPDASVKFKDGSAHPHPGSHTKVS